MNTNREKPSKEKNFNRREDEIQERRSNEKKESEKQERKNESREPQTSGSVFPGVGQRLNNNK